MLTREAFEQRWCVCSVLASVVGGVGRERLVVSVPRALLSQAPGSEWVYFCNSPIHPCNKLMPDLLLIESTGLRAARNSVFALRASARAQTFFSFYAFLHPSCFTVHKLQSPRTVEKMRKNR
jgi:hypothetical protein